MAGPLKSVQSCDAMSQSDELCQTWATGCSSSDLGPGTSVTFEYIGADKLAPGGHDAAFGDGSYTRNTMVYDSSVCLNSSVMLSIVEIGTMAVLNVSDHSQTLISQTPAHLRVTPLSAAGATALNTACPCGGMWTVNTTRTLTTCLPNACQNQALLVRLQPSFAYALVLKITNKRVVGRKVFFFFLLMVEIKTREEIGRVPCLLAQYPTHELSFSCCLFIRLSVSSFIYIFFLSRSTKAHLALKSCASAPRLQTHPQHCRTARTLALPCKQATQPVAWTMRPRLCVVSQ